jgi:hypothetical protein
MKFLEKKETIRILLYNMTMILKLSSSSVVMLCSVEVGYQCFGGLHCLPLHFNLKMEAARSSETLVSYHNTS